MKSEVRESARDVERDRDVGLATIVELASSVKHRSRGQLANRFFPLVGSGGFASSVRPSSLSYDHCGP